MKRVIFNAVTTCVCFCALVFGAYLLSSTPKNNAVFADFDENEIMKAFEPYIDTATGDTILVYRMNDKMYYQQRVIEGIAQPPTPIGYNYNPLAIYCIDETRYIVADFGGVKLMRSADDTPIADFPETDQKKAKLFYEIRYDLWQNVYLRSPEVTGSKWHNYTINLSNNTVRYIGETDPNYLPTTPITDSTDRAPYTTLDAKTSLCRETGELFRIVGGEIERTPAPADYFKILDTKTKDFTKHIYEYANRQNIFMRAGRDVVLYRFPNAVRPIEMVSAGAQFQIITERSELYNADQTDITTAEYGKFNWAYVLHQTYGGVYVENRNGSLMPTTYSREGTALDFDVARTLMNDLPIWRFPTTRYPLPSSAAYKEMIIGHLPRNFALSGVEAQPGLKILREITIHDAGGRAYYEIRIDINGHAPNPNRTGEALDPERHAYVGYIDSRFVTDSRKLLDEHRVSTNAKIVLPPDKRAGGISVYYLDVDGNLVANENETLYHGARVQVTTKLNEKFTKVLFAGYGNVEGDHDFTSRDGYIETIYISRDGITPWQIVSVIALITSLGVVVFISIQYLKKRRQ